MVDWWWLIVALIIGHQIGWYLCRVCERAAWEAVGRREMKALFTRYYTLIPKPLAEQED